MFLIMIKHYLNRVLRDKIMLFVYGLLPLAISGLNYMIFSANTQGDAHMLNGYNVIASSIVMSILILFQIFSSSTIIDYLHADVMGGRRWRLMAAPRSFFHYIFAATIAAVIFSMVSGAVLLVVSYFLFNVYMFNLGVVFIVMLILSFMAQMFGILLFIFFKKKSTTEAIIMVSGFAMQIFAGRLIMGFSLGESVDRFFQHYTPYTLGLNAIFYSGTFAAEPGSETFQILTDIGLVNLDMGRAFINIGILVAISVILTAAVYMVQRRRPL
ncbi:MAG: ABC transporter permease [Defluviitaleaceae bacterium]|nr:ABC transporter permease [Defluviitaleaceae bacterium]